MSHDRYLEFLQRLEATPQATFHFGLEAMHAALNDLGLSKPAPFVVTIAGTNGKGTIGATLHAMLLAAGIRSAFLSSPHLVDFRERIRLDGEPISVDTLLRIGTPILDAWGKTSGATPRHLSYFELCMVMGFAAAADAHVDVLVVEVGLGGRLDAANALDADAAVFASIALDHTEFLGDTLTAIAAEKAGIAREGKAAFMHRHNGGARELGAALVAKRADIYMVDEGTSPKAMNQALAAEAFRHIVRVQRPATGARQIEAAVERGIATVRWPGRQERLAHQGHQIWIDGAHNRESALALAQWLADEDAPTMPAVVALSGGRSVDDIYGPILPWVSAWYVCAPAFARATPADTIASALNAYGANTKPVYVAASAEDALAQALAASGAATQRDDRGNDRATATTRQEPRDVLVFGSLYLVGEIYAACGFGGDRLPSILADEATSPRPSSALELV